MSQPASEQGSEARTVRAYADREADERDKNRDWIAEASEEQLRDVAYWLNAYAPFVFSVAARDITENIGDD